MLSLEELFCSVDDFCQIFEPLWHQQLLNDGHKHRQRSSQMSLSEMMTIEIAFHPSAYYTFKAFYNKHVCEHWADAFPHLLSYSRFVDWIPSLLMPLSVYLHQCFGSCTGLSVMDATKVTVCHNRRIHSHKVFKGLAERGKTSTGWFYGFKLHLLINDKGELLNMTITPGNLVTQTMAEGRSETIANQCLNCWRGALVKSLQIGAMFHRSSLKRFLSRWGFN